MTIYPLAANFWKCPLLVIKSRGGYRIATFPIEFLRRGGDNTWSYILFVVSELIETAPDCSSMIVDADGVPMEPSDQPLPGIFWLAHTSSSESVEGASDVSFSHGPEYSSSFKAPNLEGSVSTRSDSKRSSEDQSRFLKSILARDGYCVVSGSHWESCTACHIVPQGRPDIYEQIYGDVGGLPVSQPSAGLLLRDDLHHAFDRLYLSLYLKDDVLYVHFFSTRLPGALELHGKPIRPEWFRGADGDRPDPVLIRWHYRQCVKARTRILGRHELS